jgi:transposase
VVVLDDAGQVVGEGEMKNAALASYAQQFSPPIRVTFEATRNWQYVYDQLEGRVSEILMAHPKKVKAIASARIKTDKIDARILADLLRVNLLPTSYAPPQAIRDARDLIRHRSAMVRQRTQIKNRIHALLARYPFTPPGGGLFTRQGMAFLETVAVRSHHRFILDNELFLLQQHQARIKAADRRVKQEVHRNGMAALLKTMPGVGDISALTIAAELGTIERFDSPKQICSYAGLVPSVRNSGGQTRHGKITKEGSTWLRSAIVEAAQSAIRYSPYFQHYHARIAFRNGRNAAKVAVARKMLTIAFWMLQRGEPYREKSLAAAV